MAMLPQICPRSHLVANNALLALTKLQRCSHNIQSRSSNNTSTHIIISTARRAFSDYASLRTTSSTLARKVRTERMARLAYPERLLIYHGGTLKTTLVGSFKLASVLAFVFFSVGVAPALAQNVEIPNWVPPLVVVLGAVPVFGNAWLANPFVNSIYIRLPTVARQSKGALDRFIGNVSSDTRLEIVTLRLVGLSKTDTVMLGELRSKRFSAGLDISNMVRIPNSKAQKEGMLVDRWRKLAELFEPRNRFFVGGKYCGHDTKAPFVWGKILEKIKAKGILD